MFVQEGYYATGIYRFIISFPTIYPDSPMGLRFTTTLVHPLVHPRGTVDLSGVYGGLDNAGKASWVLQWIERMFDKGTLDGLREEECGNKEYYRMYVLSLPLHPFQITDQGRTTRYRDSHESFLALVNQSVNLSRSDSTLYDHKTAYFMPSYTRDAKSTNKDVGIRFTNLEEAMEEKVLQEVEQMGRRKLRSARMEESY